MKLYGAVFFYLCNLMALTYGVILLPPFERSLEQQGNFTQSTARGKNYLTYLNVGFRVFQTLM